MASGGYGRRKAPISRFVPADDISRFTPSPLTTRSPNRWPTSANYLARETSRSYYDELENDVTANDAYSGDGDEETMTLSRRVLSREASIAEDDDDRYDNLDSRTNRIVVDEGEDSDDSSIYDDKDEDDDNDIADDEDDLSEESVLEDDAGVVKVQKRDTTTTHTIANRYHAAVSKIAINKHSNYESDSSEGSEHVGAGGVADRYELVKAMFKILSPPNVPLEIIFFNNDNNLYKLLSLYKLYIDKYNVSTINY